MGGILSKKGDEWMSAEEYAEVEEEKAENEVKQRKAIQHVVANIYTYAPVKMKLSYFPKNSPRAGQSFVWITIDDQLLRRQERELKATGKSTAGLRPDNAPPEVMVDSEGNIVVSGSDSPEKISEAELKLSTVAPAVPSPPSFHTGTPTSISLKWSESPGLVDQYEVEYAEHDAGRDPVWKTLIRSA